MSLPGARFARVIPKPRSMKVPVRIFRVVIGKREITIMSQVKKGCILVRVNGGLGSPKPEVFRVGRQAIRNLVVQVLHLLVQHPR